MWPYPWTHVGTPSHLGHMDRVAATMPSQAHAGAAQEAPDIGQWEGQDVPLVRPSSCNVKGGIPSSRRYLPTYLVVDYSGLNAQTQHDCYTLPLIEDMLQKQHRRRIFTVIDLKHGYHQMPLAEESRACTAMSTPLGPLQWKVMPMGVTNGNAAFQRML